MTLKIRRAPTPTGSAEHRLALVEFIESPDDPSLPSGIYRCVRTRAIWRKGALNMQWAIEPPPGTQMVSLQLLDGDDDLREDDVLRPLRGKMPAESEPTR